jgi:Mn-dependent DtxR family transcriptional regulator
VLTQCETLVAMRLIHDADCTAVENWLRRTRDKEIRAEIMETLPDLDKGEAWVWSPEARFGPVRMRFPMFETFDSFAAIQSQKKVSAHGWANVDLDDVRAKMASVIEEAKASDPRELRKQIAALKMEMLKGVAQKPSTPAMKETVKRIEVPVLKDGQIARLEKLVATLDKTLCDNATRANKALMKVIEEMPPIVDAYKKFQQPPAMMPAQPASHAVHRSPATMPRSVVSREPRPPQHREAGAVTPGANGDDAISRPQQRILDALADLEALGLHHVSKSNAAVFADQSPTSSSFQNNLGALRTRGLVHYPGQGNLGLTDDGRARAKAQGGLLSLAALHEAWFSKLANPKVRILKSLIQVYPDALSKDELAQCAEASITSSSYQNNLGNLRSLGLVDYPQQGKVVATELLFPPNLS